MTADPSPELLRGIRRNLVGALALAAFIEFGDAVGLAATFGAFSGGTPTTTPPLAVGYLLVSLAVTVGVIVRIRQLIAATDRIEVPTLKRLATGRLVLAAWLLSAILPGMLLASARDQIERLPG